MIRKTLFLFILVFVLCGLGCNLFSSTGYAKSVDEMKIITENYPPYNYLDEGEMSGIAVDLMALMLKKNNSKQTRRDIKLLPWARGYVTLLNEKNTCLFSTTRTEHRENLFKWVGPISPTTVSLIARKDRKISIRTIADIKKYRIGVIIDDIGEQLLMKSGVPKDDLDRVGGINVTLQSIRKLNLGRIDMWAYEENVAYWEIKAKGFDHRLYETVYILEEAELYYAFNIETPDVLIKKMQTALNELKKEGKYKAIFNKFLK